MLIQQVYHSDKYQTYRGPGWKEWQEVANDVTVELIKRIEEIRGGNKRGKK
jgi:hypothetical protein